MTAWSCFDLVKTVEREKENFGPQVIFTHHSGDLNVDHRRTFQAVLTATRPMKAEEVRCLITFETPSSTEWQAADDPRPFRPNLYLPVREEDVEAKCEGMEAYTFESRSYPHPRSPQALRALARRHGVSMGAEYAEAFTLVRMAAEA
ncbi:MAG: hypothetical protein U5K31_02520 [Balneolaceae bacterium]|nr:hypothetical protein [Balneolaceae bacterium]